MIAKLKGRVDTVGDTWAIVDVQGVGYLLSCSRQTLSSLPKQGEFAEILVETMMKAEQLTLYGFLTSAEKEYFKILITVQGIGGRMALSILSVAAPNVLSQAILSQQETILTQADGVGPKLAARIVRELKDKVGKLDLGALGAGSSHSFVEDSSQRVHQEALSALTNLGYRRTEALDVLSDVMRELGTVPVETLIAQSLKKLSLTSGVGNG
jgi:Holliday junction DNA helicase RuvA